MSKTLEKYWEVELSYQKKRLSKQKYQAIVKELGYATFQNWLRIENVRYSKQTMVNRMIKLEPVLNEFGIFVRSITTMIQGGGEIGMLVWGSIQAVLDAAAKYAGLLEEISTMLEDISQLMPQLATYSTLFPGKKVLHICLKSLISDFVGFCIDAVIFFKRWPIYSLLRLFWFSLDRQFKIHRSNVIRHRDHFDRQRQLAVDAELLSQNRKFALGQEKMEAMLPVVNIKAKQPEKLYMVPFQQNPRFHARGDTLQLLHQYLYDATDHDTLHQKSCVVHGGGGIGKTQLAIQYTYQYRHHFDYIIWICAESETELANGMAGLAKRLEICANQDTTNRAAIEAARTWLETTGKRWLIVFDNVERWEDLRLYWPSCASGSILITSQVSELGLMTSSSLRLSTLGPIDGADFLIRAISERRVSQEATENARLISEALGGHPLAIVHVAGYIRQSNIDLGTFLRLFEKRNNISRVLNQKTSLFQYDKSLKVVHEMALQELDDQSLKVAQVLSILSAEGIPIEMLSVDASQRDCKLDFLKLEDESSLHLVIRQLKARHLVECQGSGKDQMVFMHRSLQLHLLQRLDGHQEGLQLIFDAAVSLTRLKFPRQSPIQFPQNNIWESCQKYSPHIISILDVHAASPVPPECSIDYALLLSDASNYFYERNIFGDALRTANASIQACQKFKTGHEFTRADIHTIAAAVRDTSGISERSKTLHHYMMAIALRQEYLIKSDPKDITRDDLWNYATAWGNMTPILLDYECYEDVILYAELAMTIKRKLLGRGSESVIACYEQYRNKHIALAALGHHEEAQFWEPDPENCMRDPRYTVYMIRYYFFHANIAIICGNLDSAYKSLQKTLSIRTDILGPTSRSTLDTLYLLAMLESKRGNDDAAESYLRKALERPDDWTDEACARAKYRLAQLLLIKRNDDEAQTLLKEASQVRASFWEEYATYWPQEVDLPDEDAIYDHIVPAEAGRLVMTKFLPPNTMTRELNGVCRNLGDLLGSDDIVLTTDKLSVLLKTQPSLLSLVLGNDHNDV